MLNLHRTILIGAVTAMILCSLVVAYTYGVGAGERSQIEVPAATPVTQIPPVPILVVPQTDTIFSSGRDLPDPLIDLTKEDPKSSYDFVAQNGGTIINLDDGKNYGVWWQPEDFDIQNDTVLVSLGGHAGWATRDFSIWYPHISERGYGFFSLQYWFGQSLEKEGYYEPEEMYAMIRQVLLEKGVPPGHVIFQGYSMGSARSYGITALDSIEKKYFAVTISNSGVWEDGYRINAAIMSGMYGSQPFGNSHWILYCAVQDTDHPDWNKCEKMEKTKLKIENYGGKVDLYIKDEIGSHGGFMMNSENARKALDVADGILSTE